jgi:hypothetical protein
MNVWWAMFAQLAHLEKVLLLAMTHQESTRLATRPCAPKTNEC